MKKHFAIIFFGFTALLFADYTNYSIDAQIEAIKKAPPERRVAMMNALKERLANMNNSQRQEAIAKMRAKMQTKKRSRTHDSLHLQKYEKQMQDRMQGGQMQMQEHMSQMENMNQKHAGEHHMQEHRGETRTQEQTQRWQDQRYDKGEMPHREKMERMGR